MKAFKIFVIFVLALVSVQTVSAQKKKKLKENEVEVLFSVPMDCGSCVAKLNEQLPYLKGLKNFKVSMEDQTIWVVYNKDKTTSEKIMAEFKEIDDEFIAKVAKSSAK